MVRIPTFAGRSDATATKDENADGVVDGRDDAIAAERAEQIDERAERRLVRGRRDGTADVAAPAVTDTREPLVNDRATGRVVEAPTGRVTDAPTGRVVEAPTGRVTDAPTGRVVTDPTTTGRITPVTTAPVVTEPDTADTEPAAVPRGPRPRASLSATLGLLFGVVAAATVLTGVLADFGLALGVLGALFSVGGFSATTRRHVAGRFDAILGFLLSLAAVVLGILAVTGSLSWLSLDTDTIPAFHTWLHSQWSALTN
ncbi:hypothetical protein GCM10009682_07200 [Luedemannella flava]|uniref:DUF4190 domain-containing protein n=1 Tax=Luedemannella flava TaxID=349316 RepID=A0ABP4XQD8_9ACTN